MNYKLLKNTFFAVLIIATGCTGNYIDINSDPYGVTGEQTEANGYNIGAAISTMAGTVISPDVNTTQFTECLLGGVTGGYFVSSNNGWLRTIDNYNATDDWTRVLMASDQIMPKLYSNLNNLYIQSSDSVVHAIGTIIKVAAMHRVTDTYGPIPYTKIKVGGALQVSYDSQKEVYDSFFEELNSAISILTANRTGGIAASADYIYGGSAEKWCKFANSLKLRLAMRIVYADKEKAKMMAEEAVNHEIGVMTSNADNATIRAFGGSGNPIYVAVNYNNDGSNTGGDTHVAADIIAYMNALEDPRREKYFSHSDWTGEDFVGMRRGIIIPDFTTTGRKYSGVKLDIDSYLYWMNASEVAFLRAEGAAVFGFNMNGTAQSLYEEGIRLSFENWGADGYSTYLAQNVLKQVSYIDPAGDNTYSEVLSDVSVSWDDNATTAEKQEKIIVQKWIANWLIGHEAWSDYRRTGYPVLIPVTEAGNKSGGIVNSKLGARRMPYPQIEATTNITNYQDAVSNLLNGADNMATRVWWDQNPSIK